MPKLTLLVDLTDGNADRVLADLRREGATVRVTRSIADLGKMLSDVEAVVIAHDQREVVAREITLALRTTAPGLPVRVVPPGASTATGSRRLGKDIALLQDSARHFGLLIGESPPMRNLYAAIRRVAGVDVPVLLRGESGTGKELVAAAIHRISTRRDGPLVRVNCAALPGTLLETELFGHRRGAFTGAVSDRVGRLESASGGTLFLDEIDSASIPLQGKLLRAIEQKEFERVGEDRTRKTDMRIIAATNANLPERMDRHEFRMDLYYRLAGVEVDLPPLRSRGDDIFRLFSDFVMDWSGRLGREVLAVQPRVRSVLLSHPWPGNVRQLWNAACAAVLSAEGRVIRWRDLPRALEEHDSRGVDDRLGLAIAAMITGSCGSLYRSVIEETERQLLAQVLQRTDGNIRRSARMLGIARNTLKSRIRQFDLLSTAHEVGEEDSQAFGAGLGVS